MKRILALFALATLVILSAGCRKEINIALNQSELTVEKGTVAVLTVKFTPANASGKTLTWVSSNPDVATVTANGDEGKVFETGDLERSAVIKEFLNTAQSGARGISDEKIMYYNLDAIIAVV